jgi:hypothetical protein
MPVPKKNEQQSQPQIEREYIHLRGDAPDPVQHLVGGDPRRGLQMTMGLRRGLIGQPRVAFRPKSFKVYGKNGEIFDEVEITADVYQHEGEELQVHWMCPKCGNNNLFRAGNKKIEYLPNERIELGGRISIERFKCSWMVDTARKHFGMGLCNLVLVVDDNRAWEAA